jgi:hypothetical protein
MAQVVLNPTTSKTSKNKKNNLYLKKRTVNFQNETDSKSSRRRRVLNLFDQMVNCYKCEVWIHYSCTPTHGNVIKTVILVTPSF